MLKDHRPEWAGFVLIPILIILLLSSTASATLIVDPSIPITHKVVIQPIQVKKTNGTTANFMGSPSTESYIKQQINLIWAQLGVEIEWLALADYTNDFAYDGSPGNYTSTTRSTTHLNTIVTSSGTPPKSSDPTNLNMFFVRIPPGFNQLDDNYAAGLAYIDRNGSSIFVGSNLLNYPNGRDTIASVIAHEIGHMLGLQHFQSSTINLMYAYIGTEPPGTQFGEKLITSQSSTIFTDNSGIDGYEFLEVLTPESNYLVWEGSYGLTEGPTGDDDHDHLSNAFEFLYGSSPVAFTPHPSATTSPQGLTWLLPKAPAAVADGFSYSAESSLTLSSWLPAGSTNSGSSVLTNNPSNYSVRLNSGYPRAFIRFDVEIPATAAQIESSFPSNEPETWLISDGHQATAIPE